MEHEHGNGCKDRNSALFGSRCSSLVQVPVIREKVSDRSLNRISWSTDGRRIAAGDSAGVLSIYDCGQVDMR